MSEDGQEVKSFHDLAELGVTHFENIFKGLDITIIAKVLKGVT